VAQALAERAFGSFRGCSAITMSPAMGHCLDMADNAKADPAEGKRTNFARELCSSSRSALPS
jgi:uncharacterized protein (DUF1800 family)